jgi:ribosome maturation factor RimP
MDLALAAKDVLAPLGFEVLEVSASGGKGRVLVRIDRSDEEAVSLDDVALASEVFGLELDRLDPFAGPYRLEVESPGPQRPLLRKRHFERFQGLKAKVHAGGESFTGVIGAVDDEQITFEVNGQARSLKLSDIGSATLAEWPETLR